ncbi:phosphotransferase family protein [Fredinandcohnia sp. 179-A 10B2 NHS]|uniref:phosphotransferase family protein n=1 Tax=Fredinandcohnia sp. 179-A 10B2 NHS TaxID=3235176 RepID=UPI0039A0059B
MSQYLSLNKNISINKNTSVISLPILLYRCKPLMPKNHFKRLRVVMKYLLLYMKNGANEKTIGVNGEIALRVGYNNYKVINMKDNIIYTVYTEENESIIFESLEYRTESLMYEKILEIDQINKIIKGQFYNGHHPNLTNINNKYCKQKLGDLFVNLLTKSKVKEINSICYVEKQLNDSLDVLNRNTEKISNEQYQYVKTFLLSNYGEFIRNSPEENMQLTLSHGDIKQDNLLESNGEVVLIDWEFCGFRSPMYDFIKFKRRFSSYGDIFFLDIKKIIINYLISSKNRSLIKYFQNDSKKYMNIFYLEDINLKLKQFETRRFARDFSRIINHIKGIKNE